MIITLIYPNAYGHPPPIYINGGSNHGRIS